MAVSPRHCLSVLSVSWLIGRFACRQNVPTTERRHGLERPINRLVAGLYSAGLRGMTSSSAYSYLCCITGGKSMKKERQKGTSRLSGSRKSLIYAWPGVALWLWPGLRQGRRSRPTQRRRYRLGLGVICAGAHDDSTRPGSVLWRLGPAQKRPGHADAQLYLVGHDQPTVGAVGIQPGIWL